VLARARRIQAICSAHGVALPAAALQLPLGHPAVAGVLAGMRSAAEVRGNAAHLAAPIPAALWVELRSEGLLDPRLPLPPTQTNGGTTG
jgi:D-threo-aldose 1-dehydrogenase